MFPHKDNLSSYQVNVSALNMCKEKNKTKKTGAQLEGRGVHIYAPPKKNCLNIFLFKNPPLRQPEIEIRFLRRKKTSELIRITPTLLLVSP